MYTAACTFTPLSRNRFVCNCCRNGNGGPLVLKHDQVDGHRTAVFKKKNPPKMVEPSRRPERESRTFRPAMVVDQRQPHRREIATIDPFRLIYDIIESRAVEALANRAEAYLKTRNIDRYAETWLCPECFERMPFGVGLGTRNFADTRQCDDCRNTYLIVRV